MTTQLSTFQILCTASIVVVAGCMTTDETAVKYVSHYTLTETELDELPKDLSYLGRKILDKTVSAIPDKELKAILSRCPYRRDGDHNDRLIWGFDDKHPEEGDRCIFFDLDKKGRVVACGLAIIG